jgi:hypothetical protein
LDQVRLGSSSGPGGKHLQLPSIRSFEQEPERMTVVER